MNKILFSACSLLAVFTLAVCSNADSKAPASPAAAVQETQTFTLPALLYAQNALEPYISEKTISFHYGKHHKGYLDNLNKLTAGTDMAKLTLEEIVKQTAETADKAAIFNNAAQVWNHSFFWTCMKPGGGGTPSGNLLKSIEASFGSYEKFKAEFAAAGMAQFGSGWVWLVQDGASLKIVKTSNADTPIARGQNVLLTCDVWEHAYYLDYQNRRKDFIQAFLDNLVNWDFAAARLK